MSSLSPFSNTGLGYGLGLYRPRRPSYTYATQAGRQRTESYRYALRKSGCESDSHDFIEGIADTTKRSRKESYLKATKADDAGVEMRPIEIKIDPPQNDDDSATNSRYSVVRYSDEHMEELKTAILNRTKSLDGGGRVADNNVTPLNVSNERLNLPDKNHVVESTKSDNAGTPNSELSSNVPSIIVFTFKKNLIFLCVSYIMLFSVFRAIQNLQTSINVSEYLGIAAMSCVHGAMFFTSLWAPSIINAISAKWAIVCGMFSFLTWTGANFYPRYYTLIPTALFSGWGQGILWTAEGSYILKLAFDSSRATKTSVDKEVFRFNGFFLACFQTTHIWGNLISSIVISSTSAEDDVINLSPNESTPAENIYSLKNCGPLYPCSSFSKDHTPGEFVCCFPPH